MQGCSVSWVAGALVAGVSRWSVSDRVEFLCDLADSFHTVEAPTASDLREWEDWTVARRLRELAAEMLESGN